MQSLSYVILMYVVLLIGLAFNCIIVPSLVGLVCLCSVVPLLLNLVDEVTSALHERLFQEVAGRYTDTTTLCTCAGPDLASGSYRCAHVLLLHPTPTCADPSPDLLQ